MPDIEIGANRLEMLRRGIVLAIAFLSLRTKADDANSLSHADASTDDPNPNTNADDANSLFHADANTDNANYDANADTFYRVLRRTERFVQRRRRQLCLKRRCVWIIQRRFEARTCDD